MKPAKELDSDLTTLGADWPPLRADFFSGSLDRATEVGKAYRGRLEAGKFSS
jgi:hypothetical protein